MKFIIPLTLALWVVECAIPQNEHPSEGLHALLKLSDEKDAEETTTILGDLENINGELNAELRKLLAESYKTGGQRKLLSQRKIVLAGLKNTELGFLPNGENYKTSITVLPDGRTVRYNGSNRKINAVATDGAFSLNAEPDSFKMFYYEVEIVKRANYTDGMGARYYDDFFLEFAYRHPARYNNIFSEYYSLAEFNYDGSKEHYKVQSFKDGKFGETYGKGENASVIGVGLVVPPADELVKKSGTIRPRALVTVNGQLLGKLLPVDYTDWPAWLHNDEIRADDDRITSLLTKISPKILVRSFGTDLKVNFGEDPESLAIWAN